MKIIEKFEGVIFMYSDIDVSTVPRDDIFNQSTILNVLKIIASIQVLHYAESYIMIGKDKIFLKENF